MPYKSKEMRSIHDKEYRKKNHQKVLVRERRSHEKDKEAKRQRRKITDLKRKYGLTPEEKKSIIEAQGHSCACCGDYTEKFDIDHNHRNGKVRGLVCHLCNCLFGFACDDPERLRLAIAYLEGR